MRDVPTLPAGWLDARCRDNGEGCLIWTGYMARGGCPRATFGSDAIPYPVRRVIFKDVHGFLPRKGVVVATCCGVHGCVRPEHIISRSKGMSQRGKTRNVLELHKMAAPKRASSRLSQEDARAIRLSSQTPTELAARYGISRQYVHKILKGQSRVDYYDPFARLAA